MSPSPRAVRDVTYAVVDGVELQLDLHLPPPSEQRVPLAVYFHGGGFEVGSRTDYEPTRAAAIAARGVAVASVSYRLVGVAAFPAQLDDARAAVDWLRAHGAQWGLDTRRIGVIGASAGGYLAGMLGLGAPEAGVAPAAAAAVVWGGMLDLGMLSNGSPLELELFPLGPDGGLLGSPYDPANPAHRAVNPIANVTADAADFLLLTGDRDRVIDAAQSERLHTALVLAGAHSTLVVVGGAGHEDPAIDAPEYADLIAGFLRSRLG